MGEKSPLLAYKIGGASALPPSGVGIGFELDGPMVPVLIEVAPMVSKTKEIAPNDPMVPDLAVTSRIPSSSGLRCLKLRAGEKTLPRKPGVVAEVYDSDELIAYSSKIRHLFQSKPASDSDSNLPPITK